MKTKLSLSALQYEVREAYKELKENRNAQSLRYLGSNLTARQIYLAAEELNECTKGNTRALLNCLEYLTQESI